MAPGCRKTQNNKSVYFHRLPLDKTILLKRWIANTKLKIPQLANIQGFAVHTLNRTAMKGI